MSEPRVHVEHFTDPGCPFAFSAEPSRVKAKWHYGDQVEFADRMVVLSDSPEQLLDQGVTTERMASTFTRLHDEHGMPLADEPLSRMHHTRPACALVVGVRVHAPERAERVLRELRKLGMAGELLDERATLIRAAERAGLDPEEALEWADSPDTLEALEEDWRAARAPGAAAHGPLRRKLSVWEGGHRYSAPSWVVTAGNAGGAPISFEVPGFQPYDAYEIALANAAPQLERRDSPADAADALAWAEREGIGPLATAEVAALLDVSVDEARSALGAAGASFDPVGLDGYWSLAPVPAATAS